jgi:hypothetical protein
MLVMNGTNRDEGNLMPPSYERRSTIAKTRAALRR